MPELDLWTTYYSQPKNISFSETPIPLLVTDPDLKLSLGNPASRDLFQLAEGVDFSAILVRDLAKEPEVMDEVVAGLREHRKWSGFLEIRKLDGSSQLVHLMARVLFDQSFTPAAVIFLFEDSSESAVAFLNNQGELTHVDDTFLDLWQYGDEEEVLSLSFEQLWEEKEKARSVMSNWKRGEDWQGELTAVRSDGVRRDVELVTKVVTDDTGRTLSPILTCFDVTERKLLETEAGKLVRELGAGIDLTYFMHRRRPVQRMGVNFGAPGDRKAKSGTLWLEWPTNAGPSPAIQLDLKPEDSRFYGHHSSWIRSGESKWVVASGVSGVSRITLWIADKSGNPESVEGRLYDVLLYFAEPDELESGDRIFDVKLQGELVLSQFDIVRKAGGARKTVIERIEEVFVGEKLSIELVSNENSRVDEAVISGIEIIARPLAGSPGD
jgi:PAS domain S-box-containing protein